MDAWHFWDLPNIHEHLTAHVDRLVGIQVSDYREPTRGWCDRVLPGEGVIDLASFFSTLTKAGYKGWYDVEVFSDNGLFGTDYSDSIWHRSAVDVSQQAVSSVRMLWEQNQ